MNMIASLFIVASFVATSYGYGEACAALNVPSGVCAPLGSCPPNTAHGAPILTSLVNTCPDASAICCSTEISPFDFSYRGPCVGVSIPDGTCKGLLQSCQYGLLTGIVGTCPLGAYCCGAVQVIGKEGDACSGLHAGQPTQGICTNFVKCAVKLDMPAAGGTCALNTVCCGNNLIDVLGKK
uniref:Uncharacterized protein n=1 Tax=Acrobeloides nanus TaxID=290746 RepID=A0A914DUE5_9BILA